MSDSLNNQTALPIAEGRKKRFPIWIPVAVVLLAAAGILLYVYWWPVAADEAYELTLKTQEIVLTIENGIPQETALEYTLSPKSRLLERRAEKSFAETGLIWSVSDPTVAAVDADGKVWAVDEGEAVITGQFGSLSVSCPVTVYYPLKGLTYSVGKMTLQKSDTASLTVWPVPMQAELPAQLTFRSSDDSIVQTDGKGRLKALAVGEADVTVSGDGFEAVCRVTVLSAMTGIRIETAPEELNVGDSAQLYLVYIPEDTTDDRSVVWESLDPAQASVDDNGRITALAPGTATVRAQVGKFLSETSFTVFAPLKGISFDTDNLFLLQGEEQQLHILLEPENTTDDPTVSFSSSDPDIASVDENGLVMAVNGGETEILARAGGFTAVCPVRVRVPMTGLLIDGVNRTLKKGDTAELTVSFSPEDTNDDRTVAWISDDDSVASVDENGLVTAVGAGETLITASCGDFSDKVRITVIIPAEEVTISRDSLEMARGENFSLSAEVLPENTTESRDVAWSSSDRSVAAVDQDGNVTAVGRGSCTVTASHGKFSASCQVTVTVPLTGIGLTKTDVTLLTGDSVRLGVEYDPDDTTDDKTVSWSTSDSNIAEVSNGTVYAVSAGTCTVTAAVGDHTASATVRVNQLIRVSSVTLSRTSVFFTERDSSVQLTASVSPWNATYPAVRWSSSDSSVAVVDSNGKVWPAGNGSCMITATADGVSASCTVTASLPPPAITIVLDPGHGPWTGAIVNWNGKEYLEKDLTLATAYACRYYLLTHYSNINVLMTREDDIGVYGYYEGIPIGIDIDRRAIWAANQEADLLVCLHYNSGGSNGAMVFASEDEKVKEASQGTAWCILNELGKLGFEKRGVIARYDEEMQGNYYAIIRRSDARGVPAVLVEHCFMDSASDWAMLDTDAIGAADAIGIANYLGLKKK